MIIPAKFKLFGSTIKVIYKRNLVEKQEAYGMWYPDKNIIYLQQSTRDHKLSKEQVEQTFIHEATHALLELMGHHKLSQDEIFVSTLSNLIHQFIVEIHD